MSSPAAAESIRILLVASHAVLRQAVRLLLDGEPSLTVVGEAESPKNAVDLAAQEQPDIVLLEVLCGCTRDTLQYIPAITDASQKSRVLVLTASEHPQDYREAMTAGAMGLVSKRHDSSVLFQAIARVQAGEVAGMRDDDKGVLSSS
jgi:two-component system, NarL family, response regulator DevR